MDVTVKKLAILGVSMILPLVWIANSTAANESPFPMPAGPVYIEECGSCHTAYAPGLLPARSWDRMMGELNRHFGEDASLDPETTRRLAMELRARASDSSRADSLMRRINAAIPPGEAPQRITQTAFFKFMHDEVPASIWTRAKIGNPSNCGACHVNADTGRYAEREVKIPK
ncbi:MAG: diheme cytochrome c [Thiobacillus sp.]